MKDMAHTLTLTRTGAFTPAGHFQAFCSCKWIGPRRFPVVTQSDDGTDEAETAAIEDGTEHIAYL